MGSESALTTLLRYSRQTLVEQFGLQGQEALSRARVLIVGAGGLGCTVGAQLAGAGVSQISIVDHDTIDLSNLHRQVLFRESDVGQAKANIAAQQMMGINSEISVTAINARLSPSNVSQLCKNMDVVIDAADNFATSYLLSDSCMNLNVPLLTASVNRTFGYVGQFCSSQEKTLPSLRAAFPKLPKEQTNCDTVGVTGPSVGVIASIQSQEAIKIIIGDDSQLAGKLLYLDLWHYSQHIIDFSDAPEPKHSLIELISETDISNDDLIFDVRSEQEIIDTPLPFENVLTIVSFPVSPDKKTNNKRIICACKSGQRAFAKAQTLIDQGYKNVAALMPE